MHRPGSLLTALTVAVAVAAGCGGSGGGRKAAPPPEAFCRAAEAYDRAMTASEKPPVAEQVRLVEAMARTAPADVRDDAEAFLAAMRRVEKNPRDPRAFQNDAVEEAVDNVNRRAFRCPFFDPDDGGS